MQYFIGFIVGLVLGALIVYAVHRQSKRQVENSFSALSLEALRKNSEDFLNLANQSLSSQSQAGAGELGEKKKLIDQTLDGMKAELAKVERSLLEFDTKRVTESVQISSRLQAAAEQTNRLQETTSRLQMALANSRERGQWGERMAEDILRLIGFVENVNYTRQDTQDGRGTRPDFTFKLPQDLKVNMDVKFPWDNYRNYLNADSPADKDGYRQKFISDARQKIREIKTRDYINPEDHTVDYAIMFIPNEQVFCFLQENDPAILDDALKEKVILCSPVTLFAVLAVIRQAVHNFNLEQTSDRMLSLFGTFYRQWDEFKRAMGRMGERIEQASQEYERLASTRSRALERPLKRIEDLRKQRGIIEVAETDDSLTKELATADGEPGGSRAPAPQ